MVSEIDATIGVFDDPNYAKRALAIRDDYRRAEPFPHIVMDDFLAPELATALAEVFPDPATDNDMVERNTDTNQRFYQDDETKLKPLMRAMLREFSSRQFLLFLETLTGIEGLIPDPYYMGGGAHLSGRGGFLKVHSDWNWHHKLQAHRRVNALLYLTPGWDEAWGGGLEFWNADATEVVDVAAPVFNRLAVFSTGEDSNHGLPNPMSCPDGVYRRALNLYYYTSDAGEMVTADPHFTKYKLAASPAATAIGEDYRRSGGTSPGR